MDIDEMKRLILAEMQRQGLNERRVALLAAEKHPGIGHQYVRNLLHANKTTKVDVQKLRAVADVLGIAGDVIGEPVGPHAQLLSPQLEALIACARALAMHVISNREADSELSAFAVELTRHVPAVFDDLPQEQVLRIREQSLAIAKRCVAAGSAASKPVLHPEQS